MTLIIEDGSIVPGANSVATVVECRAYADVRGLDLPVDDVDVAALLVGAMDYLNSLERKYQGYRTDEDQDLSFPREDICYFSKDVSGTIPKALKNGQCQLAFDAQENDLLAGGSGQEIVEEKVGSITTKYNPNGNTSPQFYPTAAMAILGPLFNATSGASINLISYK